MTFDSQQTKHFSLLGQDVSEVSAFIQFLYVLLTLLNRAAHSPKRTNFAASSSKRGTGILSWLLSMITYPAGDYTVCGAS